MDRIGILLPCGGKSLINGRDEKEVMDYCKISHVVASMAAAVSDISSLLEQANMTSGIG